jgi:uncharacterized FlaG/YvyC family protein
MNVSGNTQANMDVAGVSQAAVVAKAGVQKPETARPEMTRAVKPSEITKTDVEQMVESLKDLTATLQTSLNFSVDEGTNNIVVKVIDRNTDKVIKQIPPESLLKLQEKMQDLTGFLLSDII